MGVVTGGGGGAFNGGTIHNPLEIDNPGSANMLVLKDVDGVTVGSVGPGGEVKIDPDFNRTNLDTSLIVKADKDSGAGILILDLQKHDGTSLWRLDRSGQWSVPVSATTLSASGQITAQTATTGTASLIAFPADSAVASDALQATDTTATTRVRVNHLGALVLALNAAPADADLAAGDCSFWFDSTNGAAKLMVKAKQANGTVVSAAIALA